MPVYRTAGAWGPGKGSNLTPAEVDENFFELRDDLDNVIANPPSAVGIANVEASGLNWIVTLTDSTVLDPVPIPVPVFRFRGEWAAFTLYSELDSFTVAGQGLYTTLVAHTSAATFDPDATTGSPPETLYQQIFPADLTATLDDLADVEITLSGSPAAPGDNDLIAYDPAALGGLGAWANRTPTAVTALLDVMEGDTGSPGGGVKGLVPAPADGDAAAGKYLDASGAWSVPPTIGFLGDLGDVDTTGAAAGDFMQWQGSPLELQPVSSVALSGLPSATLPVDQDSLIEVSEALGSPITYSSAKIRVADLAVTLGSTLVALGSTVTTIAGLTLSGGTLSGVTTLPGSGQITAAGELGIGVSPSAQFDMGGSYVTANAQAFRMNTSFVSSVTTTQNGMTINTTFTPGGASLTTAQVVSLSPSLSGSVSITNVRAISAGLTLGAGYSGTTGTAEIFRAGAPTVSGGSITNFNQFSTAVIAVNDGKSSGTSTTRQLLLAGITSSAAGGTLNNRGIDVTMPSGGASSGTTNNRGIYITGNGGTASGGTVNNFAIFSDSTAPIQIGGTFQFLGATSSFPMLKRSSTVIEVRLADDSAYAPVAGSALRQYGGENGQFARIISVTELTTIAAAATTDTAIQIPANAKVLAVSVRVTTVIPTAATFDVGIAGATTRFGTGLSTAANTTNPGTNDDGARYYAAATSVRITPNATPAANTGRVRVTIHYIDVTPPTS